MKQGRRRVYVQWEHNAKSEVAPVLVEQVGVGGRQIVFINVGDRRLLKDYTNEHKNVSR